ncbi:MAG: hypothetical protein DRO00_01045 [Thermoproteota archaeon]|nr:MAG: hypothetical protein DRO00_01045 [Candidatus Korarchaeota archaeon]
MRAQKGMKPMKPGSSTFLFSSWHKGRPWKVLILLILALSLFFLKFQLLEAVVGEQIINENWDSFNTSLWSFSGTNLTYYPITYSSATYLCVNRSSDTYHSGEATVSWIGTSISTYYFNATADNVRFSYGSTFSPQGRIEFKVGSYKICWIINSSGKFVDFYAGTTLLGSHSAISGISSYATFTIKRDIGSSQVYLEFNNPGAEIFSHYTSTILQVDSVELYFYLEVDALNDYKAAWWVDKVSFWDLSKLDTPSLISPLNGVWLASTSVSLQWTTIPEADEYWIQVSDQSDFSTLILNTTKTGNFTYIVPSEGTWYWRVKAISSTYNPSDWNSSWFRVDITAPTITILGPANKTIVSTSYFTAQWDLTDNYDLNKTQIVWRHPNGTLKSVNLSPTTGSYTIYSDDGPVEWWLKAWDDAGNQATSEHRVCYLDARLPEAPTIITPSNNSWVLSDTLWINWTAPDYDVNITRLTVQRTSGGYSLQEEFGRGNQSKLLQFVQEGEYQAKVESIDYNGNSNSTDWLYFNVVLGAVSPYNATGTAQSYSFEAKNNWEQPQIVTYTVKCYFSNGALARNESGSFSIAELTTRKIEGDWSNPLTTPDIYKIVVEIVNENGAKTSTTNFFIVSTAGGTDRDWTAWVSEETYVGQEVQVSRMYFESSEKGVGEHSVSVQIIGAKWGTVYLLNSTTFEKIRQIDATVSQVDNTFTFMAEPLEAGESKVYLLIANLSKVRAEWILEKENVIYEGIISDQYQVEIVNILPYEILTLYLAYNESWVGYEGTDWTNVSDKNALKYGKSLKPNYGASLKVYLLKDEAEAEEKEGKYDYYAYALMGFGLVLMAFLVSIYILSYAMSRRRRGPGRPPKKRWRT